MKPLIFTALLLAASPVAAQPAAPTSEIQALGATVMACVQESVNLRAQIITQQAEIERLKTAAKPAETPPKP